MVAQAAWCANDNVRAQRQLARLAPRVHAANTGNDMRSGLRIEPDEFALHLQRKLARWGDNQR